MAGLAHEVGQAGALVASGRGQPGTEPVTEVVFVIEAGGCSHALHEPRVGLVGEGGAGQPPGFAHATEQRQCVPGLRPEALANRGLAQASQRASAASGQVRGFAGLAQMTTCCSRP